MQYFEACNFQKGSLLKYDGRETQKIYKWSLVYLHKNGYSMMEIHMIGQWFLVFNFSRQIPKL